MLLNIFTGNTWKYYQRVMFLLKVRPFPFFKNDINWFFQNLMVPLSANSNIQICSGLVGWFPHNVLYLPCSLLAW